jgi:hypothetical protein
MRDDEESDAATGDRSSSLSDLAERLAAEGGRGTGDDQSLSDLAESIERRQGTRSDPASDAGSDDWDAVGSDAEGADLLDPKTEALLELVGGTANVLVSGPPGSSAGERLCSRLMASRTDEPVNLLVVTVGESPGERLSVLQNYLDTPVGETAVVDVQTYSREVSYDGYDGPVEVKTVSNAQDLRRIGIVISKLLSQLDDVPGETTMCLHSLSDLLSLTEDQQRVFRFVHLLRGRVQSAGARSHYHIDPAAHPAETLSTFQSLFDTVIQFDEDGSVSLR